MDADAEWATARLAHAAAALGRLQHDLRNMLAPSMLTAERLQLSDVPQVKRAGDVTIRGVERANAAIAATLHALRDGLRRPERTAVALGPLLRALDRPRPGPAVIVSIDDDVTAMADDGHLRSCASALLAALVALGATRIEITAERQPRRLAVDARHDGGNVPSLPFDRAVWPNLALLHEYASALDGAVEVGGDGIRLLLPLAGA